MPLRKGMPVGDAIDELVHHGSRPRPMKQIIAIAEANRHRRADGGMAPGGFSGLGTGPIVSLPENLNLGAIPGASGMAAQPGAQTPPGSTPPMTGQTPSGHPMPPFGGGWFARNFGQDHDGDHDHDGPQGAPWMHGPSPIAMPLATATGAGNSSAHAGPFHGFAHGGTTKLADGGMGMTSGSDQFAERMAARQMSYGDQYHPGGFIASDAAGRTDRLPFNVAADSFVMPADVVSGLGQGNSLAGAKIMDAILRSGPYGTTPLSLHHGSGPPRGPRVASGGHPGTSSVILAGGEYAIPPEHLTAIGARMRAAKKSNARTDLAAGHEWARNFVKEVRRNAKKFLASAPEPKR